MYLWIVVVVLYSSLVPDLIGGLIVHFTEVTESKKLI